jgi:hypothetical protein
MVCGYFGVSFCVLKISHGRPTRVFSFEVVACGFSHERACARDRIGDPERDMIEVSKLLRSFVLE